MGLTDWKKDMVYQGGYSAYLDGQFHTYQGLDKCLDEIRDLVGDVFCHAEKIEKENADLKDLHWENAMLKRMKADRDLMEADYNRGFPITESEKEAIEKWIKNHCDTQHKDYNKLSKMALTGGNFYYKFIPTSLGTFGVICCSTCLERARRNSKDSGEYCRDLIKEYDAEFAFQEP